jgi:hypothetical protein
MNGEEITRDVSVTVSVVWIGRWDFVEWILVYCARLILNINHNLVRQGAAFVLNTLSSQKDSCEADSRLMGLLHSGQGTRRRTDRSGHIQRQQLQR